MKYKLLLTGKYQVIIDDIFKVLGDEFECMTTSLRSADIVNHIRYYQPDVFVYCMNSESSDNISKLIGALETADRKMMSLVLVGDSDSCDEFLGVRDNMVDLVMHKPVMASNIRQEINNLMESKREAWEEMAARQKRLEEQEAREKALQAAQEKAELEAEQRAEAERIAKAASAAVSEVVEKTVAAETAAAASPESDNGLKHILVIDDDPLMLRVIKEELKSEYNVATAISGKIGLNFLQRKKTDLVLLDYEMPEENGPAVLEKIRANESTKDLPVVFLTGIKDREKIKKVISMKPQGYLLKPINHDMLVKTINQVIGKV